MLSVNIEQKINISIDKSLWVYADILRVRQVLTNLLDNASKYSPPDGLIQITAHALTFAQVATVLPEELIDHAALIERGDDSVVLVRVHDQGEGILPQDQRKIFEKFFRAPRSLTTPVRGSGLGLFICRRYIEAMSGRLWLERSNPNQGSVFSFYLPRIDAPISTGEQDESEYQTQ
jgi:signal transduction histidine kinase